MHLGPATYCSRECGAKKEIVRKAERESGNLAVVLPCFMGVCGLVKVGGTHFLAIFGLMLRIILDSILLSGNNLGLGWFKKAIHREPTDAKISGNDQGYKGARRRLRLNNNTSK